MQIWIDVLMDGLSLVESLLGQLEGVGLVDNRSGNAWSEEDMVMLHRMRQAGSSHAEIARALHRSEAAVGVRISLVNRRRRLGLAFPDDD